MLSSPQSSNGVSEGIRNPARYQLGGFTHPGNRSSARLESLPGPASSSRIASARHSRNAGELSHRGLEDDEVAVIRHTVGERLLPPEPLSAVTARG